MPSFIRIKYSNQLNFVRHGHKQSTGLELGLEQTEGEQPRQQTVLVQDVTCSIHHSQQYTSIHHSQQYMSMNIQLYTPGTPPSTMHLLLHPIFHVCPDPDPTQRDTNVGQARLGIALHPILHMGHSRISKQTRHVPMPSQVMHRRGKRNAPDKSTEAEKE